jgi:hypothetical protein
MLWGQIDERHTHTLIAFLADNTGADMQQGANFRDGEFE